MTARRRVKVGAAMLGVWLLSSATAPAGEYRDVAMADAHVHLVAFRSGYYLDSSSRVVLARDTDYHLALAIEDYRRAAGKAGDRELERLYVCVSGFDGADLGAVDMITKRLKEFPGLFRCIGEVMSRHDDLTDLTTGARPRGNHPALLRVFDFAGEHGIPVTIHHNPGFGRR